MGKKDKLFRVEFERKRISVYSVLVDAPTPDAAFNDLLNDTNAVYKYFEPLNSTDETVLHEVREVKRRRKT